MSKTKGSIPRKKFKSVTPGFNSQKGDQVKMDANPKSIRSIQGTNDDDDIMMKWNGDGRF